MADSKRIDLTNPLLKHYKVVRRANRITRRFSFRAGGAAFIITRTSLQGSPCGPDRFVVRIGTDTPYCWWPYPYDYGPFDYDY